MREILLYDIRRIKTLVKLSTVNVIYVLFNIKGPVIQISFRNQSCVLYLHIIQKGVCRMFYVVNKIALSTKNRLHFLHCIKLINKSKMRRVVASNHWLYFYRLCHSTYQMASDDEFHSGSLLVSQIKLFFQNIKEREKRW